MKYRIAIVAFTVLLASTAILFAQDAAAAVPAERMSENFLFFTIKSLGWFFFPVFLVTSIVAVSLVIMNAMTIRRSVLLPEKMREQFETLLEEKKFQEAWQLTQEDDSYLARILAAGLSQGKSGYDAALKAMQDVGEEETMRHEQRLNYLAVIASVAPMLGLLGTVVGMVRSFQVIAVSATAPQAGKLAEGISTALITTEIGLIIAIPCIIAYEIFKGHLARIVLEASIVSENVFARLKK
ncbi:MAG: MotA/TolQ/ExbB proton channel family protein [Thermoguttaceae bacterium]